MLVEDMFLLFPVQCQIILMKKLKGVYNRGDPPLSIPNREVKPLSADGTAERWESRLAPNFESLTRNRQAFFMSATPAAF